MPGWLAEFTFMQRLLLLGYMSGLLIDDRKAVGLNLLLILYGNGVKSMPISWFITQRKKKI